MVPPSNLLDLASAEHEAADAAEVIARAAEIVEGFAATSAIQALEALIATKDVDSLGEAALSALGVAQQALFQTETLSSELDRFLTATDKRCAGGSPARPRSAPPSDRVRPAAPD